MALAVPLLYIRCRSPARTSPIRSVRYVAVRARYAAHASQLAYRAASAPAWLTAPPTGSAWASGARRGRSVAAMAREGARGGMPRMASERWRYHPHPTAPSRVQVNGQARQSVSARWTAVPPVGYVCESAREKNKTLRIYATNWNA